MSPEEIKSIVEAVLDQKQTFDWWPIILFLLIIGITIYLRSYLAKKGKNMATKEDVAEITTRIEQVKHEYSTKLESIKTILGTRLFIHQVRYQNEFSMLLSLSEKVAKFRDALANFEIIALCNEPKEKNSTHKMALKAFAAVGALKDEYEAHNPFYPEEIYKSVNKFHILGLNKILLEGYKKNIIERNKFSNALIDMIKEKYERSDAEEASQVIEDIYATIRRRVQYWEKLHIV